MSDENTDKAASADLLFRSTAIARHYHSSIEWLREGRGGNTRRQIRQHVDEIR